MMRSSRCLRSSQPCIPATTTTTQASRVLGEYIRLHVEQEYDDIFPRARASGLNLRALGDQMRARKRVLMSATIVLGKC